MKVFLKIVRALLLLGCIMPTACKKNNQPTESPRENASPVDTQPQKQLIPLSLGAGLTKMKFHYTSDYALSEVEYGDETSSVLEYNSSGRPVSLSHYDGAELTSYAQYKTDGNGRVISSKTYTAGIIGYRYDGGFKITYQDDSLISEIRYYDGKDKLICSQRRIYAGNKNLIREQNEADLLRASYIYDDKYGLFKNVKYQWLFAIEEQNNLFHSAGNNVISCIYPGNPAADQSFSYTYNTNGYPETVTFKTGTNTLTSLVTYQTR